MTSRLPGDGLFGWLGRQVAYVRQAVRADVGRSVVHREARVEEVKLPERADVTLRRTTIDEVIIERKDSTQARV